MHNLISSDNYDFFTLLPRGQVILWKEEPCDECGRACVGANTLKIGVDERVRTNTLALLESLGLRAAKWMPGELGACDALGGIAVCDECYQD